MSDPRPLNLDRFKLTIELYGITYYWLLEFKLDKTTGIASGTAETPDQCFTAAMSMYALKIREAV
jgi:hypothetical protein